MPEDQIEEVSEQEEVTEEVTEETDEDLEAGFSDEEEVPKEEPEPEVEEVEEVEEPEPEPEPEPEEDEYSKRAQELLDEEQKLKDEESSEGEPEPEVATPYTPEEVEIFNNVIPMDRIPDTITIDGREIDMKGEESFLADYPEARALMSIAAKSVIDTLVANGVIPQMSNVEDLETRIANQRLIDRVDAALEIDSKAIHDSEDFQAWAKDDAKAQALLKSGKSKDSEMVFGRYLAEKGIKKAEEGKAEADKKARKAKEKLDAVHKSTSRKKGGRPAAPSKEGVDEMEEEFSKED